MNITPKGQIYIVEDDEEVRASSRFLVEAMGFAVEDFADAESALKAAAERPPDCLVLDYDLPGMSGLDLLEKLRQRGVNTPAIIITGNDRQMAARAARAGALAVLRKPLGAESLFHWLEKIPPGKK